MATRSSSATLPADANTILSMLQKYSFPGIYWEILAQDLFKNLTVPRKYYELKNDYARLKAVVTDWTAGVGVVGRWETIVRAVRTCHEGQIANNNYSFGNRFVPPNDRVSRRQEAEAIWFTVTIIFFYIIIIFVVLMLIIVLLSGFYEATGSTFYSESNHM